MKDDDMRLRLAAIVQSAVNPALALLPSRMGSKEARVMLLAIGLQESGFTSRVQRLADGSRGPAHGYWQFERGGGVRGVIKHEASRELAQSLCNVRRCEFDIGEVWGRVETDDVLAAGFARLLILTDPKPLPGVHEAEAAWQLYERVWRPGRPRRDHWDSFHQLARAEVLS